MAKGKYAAWLKKDNLLLLEGWARDGLTDEQIAHNIGITAKTLYEWKKKHGEIREVLKKTKEIVDIEVENALLKSAMGYDATEEVWERRFVREKGDYDLVLIKRTIKHVPPSNAAQIFWLKNRQKNKWRDKQEQEVTIIDDDTRAQVNNLINARLNQQRRGDRRPDQ